MTRLAIDVGGTEQDRAVADVLSNVEVLMGPMFRSDRPRAAARSLACVGWVWLL